MSPCRGGTTSLQLSISLPLTSPSVHEQHYRVTLFVYVYILSQRYIAFTPLE